MASHLVDPLTPSLKRKRSVHEDGSEREIKHRSSKACQSCRARKVRCDVLANGDRCTNCRLDRLECTVLPSRRGRNRQRHRAKTTEAALESPVLGAVRASTVRKASHPTNGRPASHQENGEDGGLSETDQVPICVTFEQDNNERGDQRAVGGDDTRYGSAHRLSTAYEGFPTPETTSTALPQPESPTRPTSIPAFFIPLPDRVLPEDVAYLARKGALTIPEPDSILEILRGYLFSVHPFMPMLEHDDFIGAVQHEQGAPRLSLLLFQAVMFAGLHSLPHPVIHRLGFHSAKEARKVFFDRAKLLYELDVESDTAAVVQSLVLMSLMYSTWDERRHTWHWTGLAYDAARSMGLQREPAMRCVSDKERRFRRRLWWSLYIRDRMIALGTRRPMRIRDEDFNVSILGLEDFHLETAQKGSQLHGIVPSLEERSSTARMCIQLAKLGVCIGHVVSSQYTTLTTKPDVSCTTMVLSKEDGECSEEVAACEKELDHWLGGLSANVGRSSPFREPKDPHSCSEVHWAVLNLTYWTVVNVLHRAQALQPSPAAPADMEAHLSSRSKVKDAARNLTKLSQAMLARDQIRYLSPIGVTALVAACLTHLLDVRSTDEDVRDASSFRLQQSLQGLRSLSDSYGSADAAVSFLMSASRRAGVSIPLQPLASGAGSASARGGSVPHQNRATSDSHSRLTPGNAGARAWPTHRASSNAPPTDSAARSFFHKHSQAHGSGTDMRPTEMIQFLGSPPAPEVHPGVMPSASLYETGPPASHMPGIVYGDASLADPPFADVHAGGSDIAWGTGLDDDVDFASMALNYGFHSNAFAFLDGPLQ